MIRFEAVSKTYPDGTVAVDQLDLEAPSGQITVLVGPSGCGKTTSLRMINRMIDPTGGRIWLDDQRHRDRPPAQLRRGIGYVIQHAGLFPHRTVVDNIATVPFLLGQDKRAARAAGDASCSSGWACDARFAKRYPAQLSGGQQQRVGVARALAADPPVMLMDEPFWAVDPVVRSQLQDEFLRLQAELGKTIVFVTHDIDEAIKLGDRSPCCASAAGSRNSRRRPSCCRGRPTRSWPDSSAGTVAIARSASPRPANLPLGMRRPVPLGLDLSDALRRAEDGWVWSSTMTIGRRAGWPDRRRRRRIARPCDGRPTQPRRHAGHRRRHAPVGVGRRALLAEWPWSRRRRGRALPRHGLGLAGTGSHRGAGVRRADRSLRARRCRPGGLSGGLGLLPQQPGRRPALAVEQRLAGGSTHS